MLLRYEEQINAAGSAKRTYTSKLFEVYLWTYSTGEQITELKMSNNNFMSIRFKHEIVFTSDAECISQFTPEEILEIINVSNKLSYNNGKNDKIREIKSCLHIR